LFKPGEDDIVGGAVWVALRQSVCEYPEEYPLEEILDYVRTGLQWRGVELPAVDRPGQSKESAETTLAKPTDEPAASGPVDGQPAGTATEQPATAAPEPEIVTSVSLRDVAFAIEGDDKAAKDSVQRWLKSGKIKAKPIGKCPLDARAQLYRLFEILADVQKILSLTRPEVGKYRQVLVAKQRPPQ
jgi:hypothetical protein